MDGAYIVHTKMGVQWKSVWWQRTIEKGNIQDSKLDRFNFYELKYEYIYNTITNKHIERTTNIFESCLPQRIIAVKLDNLMTKLDNQKITKIPLSKNYRMYETLVVRFYEKWRRE